MRAGVELYASQWVLKQNGFLILFICEKGTHVVVKFCAQKCWYAVLRRKNFQSSPELVQKKWGLE